MSTQEPISTVEGITARSRRGASASLQFVVLVVASFAAAVLGWVLAVVDAQTGPLWVLAAIPAGIVCFAAFLVASAWSMRAAVAGVTAPRVGGGVLLVAMLACGAAAVRVGAQDHDVPPWAWAVPAALALLVAALALVGGARRRRGAATRNRLRSGRRVEATITDDGLAAFAPSPNPKIATLTVMFHDNAGAQRWVQTGALQAPGRPLGVGETAALWFDPARPDDVSRILIEADNGASRIIPGTIKA